MEWRDNIPRKVSDFMPKCSCCDNYISKDEYILNGGMCQFCEQQFSAGLGMPWSLWG